MRAVTIHLRERAREPSERDAQPGVAGEGALASVEGQEGRRPEVDGGGDVHDCGELPRRAGGLARHFVRPDSAIESMQGFAVTIEPVGSLSDAPSTPAVLISKLLKS